MGRSRFAHKLVGKNHALAFCRAFHEFRFDCAGDPHKPHSKTTAVTEVIEELPKMSWRSTIVPPEELPFFGWYIGP